jgi:hypothetical protein
MAAKQRTILAGRTMKQRIAETLNWSIADANSLSFHSLRDLVRPLDPKLADEISDAIKTGAYITDRFDSR